jgi:hypothetical protein
MSLLVDQVAGAGDLETAAGQRLVLVIRRVGPIEAVLVGPRERGVGPDLPDQRVAVSGFDKCVQSYGHLGSAPKLASGPQLPRSPAKCDSPRPVPLNRKQPHGLVSRPMLEAGAGTKVIKRSELFKAGRAAAPSASAASPTLFRQMLCDSRDVCDSLGLRSLRFPVRPCDSCDTCDGSGLVAGKRRSCRKCRKPISPPGYLSPGGAFRLVD